jgi:hypothetical protein
MDMSWLRQLVACLHCSCPSLIHVKRFMVDKIVGQVLSVHFGSYANFHSTNQLNNIAGESSVLTIIRGVVLEKEMLGPTGT